MLAENILDLNELWECTDKKTITNNIRQLLKNQGCQTFNEEWETLMEITGSSKYAVYAWLNCGRADVKIPFLKLCKIADEYNINVENLLKGEKIMFTRKFAVTKCVGDNEEILKYFAEDEKDKALAYGAEIAKENTEGVITCIRAMFDEDGNIKGREARVFEVWES